MKGRRTGMSKKVDLACTVCTEEFLVPIRVYEALSSVVICPCCGSNDLVLLGVIEGSGDGLNDAAA
jgi:hypothetical protein